MPPYVLADADGALARRLAVAPGSPRMLRTPHASPIAVALNATLPIYQLPNVHGAARGRLRVVRAVA
eukprot:11760094-Alexandrium_andersonii.AAC.1